MREREREGGREGEKERERETGGRGGKNVVTCFTPSCLWKRR